MVFGFHLEVSCNDNRMPTEECMIIHVANACISLKRLKGFNTCLVHKIASGHY